MRMKDFTLFVFLFIFHFLVFPTQQTTESPVKYTIQTILSGFTLSNPSGLYMYNNEIYIANQYKHVVQKINLQTNVVSIVAGVLNTLGFYGDTGVATSAKLYYPYGVFVLAGNVYISDQYNNRIRKVSSNIITTVAGTGMDAYNGDSTPLSSNIFNPPSVFAVSETEFYIADFYNHRVRKVVGTAISTFAGTGGTSYNGDGIPAVSCTLNEPHGVFVRNNKVYIVDKKNHLIRAVDQSSGNIYNVAGTGNEGFGPDNTFANQSSLNDPVTVFVTADDVMFISDHENNRIRRVKDGIITTIAGNGNSNSPVDGVVATASTVTNPSGLFVNETNGKIYLSDRGSNMIRVLNPSCELGYNLNSVGSKCLTSFCFGVESNNLTGVCSGRGQCLDTNTCNCTSSGYSGTNCDKWSCFGISKDNSTVCSSNGACSSPDFCSCASNYFGTKCENTYCFGVSSLNVGVCSGKGNCIKNDKCQCDQGYYGSNCNVTQCFSEFSNSSSVCSGHGSCTSPNVCQCNSSYGGPQCQFPKCSGILSNSSSVCSGQGLCTAPNVCQCNSTFTGSNCQLPICYGIDSSNSTSVCSGHGSCTSPNVCQCNSNYGGLQCEFPKCSGILSNFSSVCSGQGLCTSPNVCQCNSSYGGPQCQFPKCSGILSNSSSVCSGQGICTAPNACQCNPSFTGSNCQLPICYGLDSSNSSVCNGHGQCIGANICNCTDSYFSNDCSQWKCFGFNQSSVSVCNGQGKCSNPNICDCYTNYFGDQCRNTTCGGLSSDNSSICSGRGKCVSYNNCSCTTGFAGVNCEYPICFGVLSSNSSVCSGNGSCVNANVCQCNSQYTGNICNIPQCYGVAQTNSSVCSGRGQCVDVNKCICTKIGYYGSNCESWSCYGTSNMDVNVCNGMGVCHGPNNCSCASNYFGSKCEHTYCFGIPTLNSTVCSGSGNCTQHDKCQCAQGYYGSDCSVIKCYSGFSNSTSVCSGRGKCTAPDKCVCRVEYSGIQCTVNLVERSFETSELPKGFVVGKSSSIDVTVLSANFRSESDFSSIVVLNNCNNCTWNNLKYSWTVVDASNVTLMSSVPNSLLSFYHGEISEGLFKLSFNPVLSLKGMVTPISKGSLVLNLVIHNSNNLSDSIQFQKTINVVDSPKRSITSAPIKPSSGEALSTLFEMEEIASNWAVGDSVLYPLSFSFGFLNKDSDGTKSVVRISEFSTYGNTSLYLPYLNITDTSGNGSTEIYVICRDSLSNEYTEYFGSVQVSPNTDNSTSLLSRIRNDAKLSIVLPFDKSGEFESEILFETVNKINIQVNNPTLLLSTINQLSLSQSLDNKVSTLMGSKLEKYLLEVNNLIKKEKTSIGYLSKAKMSETDLKNTLSTTSNLLLNGFVNVSSVCSELSSVLINQQVSKILSDSIEPISYTSNGINITISSFLKTESNANGKQTFNDIILNTDYILSKYDGYYKEIGLSLISFNEKLHENGNSSQLTTSKDFKLYKSGSIIQLSDLIEPIYISFSVQSNITNETLSCQFWNETTLKWDKEGCSVHSFNNETRELVCKCTHTTLFAAFVEQDTIEQEAYLKQVSSLYIAQISFGSLFLILSLTILTCLIIFRKSQPIASRFVTPYIGMIALIIECALLLITQRSILLSYANSALSTNDFENSQSTVIQLQNGDVVSNIISNIFTIISNTMTLTAIFSYLYQVLRFQVLKYFYHQIYERFNQKETKSETALKIFKLLLSTRFMIISMSLFMSVNVLYWTLWVILIRVGAISGITYTYIVSISFTISVILLGLSICFLIGLDWTMTLLSRKKEREIIGQGSEVKVDNETKFSLNDLISGKALEKLQKFDQENAKKIVKIPLRGAYESFIRLDSPLYFRAEMILFVICFTNLVISQIIGLSGLKYKKEDSLKTLLVNDSISLLFDILYMFSYLFVFGGYPIMVLIIRKLKKIPKSDETEKDGLLQLLEHPAGLKLFEWFCEKEYSLENLQLYLEIKGGRNVLESLDDRESLESFIGSVYSSYIEPGALKEVNIPSNCRTGIKTVIKKLKESAAVSDIEMETSKKFKKNQLAQDLKEEIKSSMETLFDQTLFNLSDTFSRFIFTSQFETYQQIVNNKTDLMKQANLQ